MIKLFRNIRRKLAAENNVAKYLRYAIGEILLVVVGILIALQINNWNQQRIAGIEEETILMNIHAEFLENKKVLRTTLNRVNKVSNISRNIMGLMGKERSELLKHNLDSLLLISLETTGFRPSGNTISDLLQSGRLQLLQNDSLKSLIYKWTRSIKSSDASVRRVELKIDNVIVPYLSKNYSMKDIDYYGNLNWKNKTTLKVDKLKIFEDIEYENILDDYLYRLNGNISSLNVCNEIIDAIIKETE